LKELLQQERAPKKRPNSSEVGSKKDNDDSNEEIIRSMKKKVNDRIEYQQKLNEKLHLQNKFIKGQASLDSSSMQKS